MPPQMIALVTAVSYASALISARRGLKYSTPASVTCFSVVIQNVALWSAVFLTGGIPRVSPVAVLVFIVVGIFQLGVRLFSYTGVQRIGASRSSALQAMSPLISASIGITWLRERPSPEVVMGTLLVVAGVVLVSRKPEEAVPNFRRRYLWFPIAAACLTGMNHPLRRYALSLSNEPLFFSALMGTVSLAGFLVYIASPAAHRELVWDRRALLPYVLTGMFETLSIFLIIKALSLGAVVVVAPIAATYPVWSLLGSAIFLRDLERITLLSVLGTLSVVTGTIAIHLGR